MDLEHHFTVDAPVDEVWTTMMDLEKVAECFPGATLTEADGDSFSGTVKVKLGPIAMVYKGSGSFTEKDESAHRAVIDAKGRDKRGNGTAGAEVVLAMSGEGSGTRVDVTTDLNVTGKPAQFGRGVMQDVSDKLLAQFTDCLARRFEEPAAGDEEAAPAEGTSAGASAPASDQAPSADSTPADSTPPATGSTAPAAGASAAAPAVAAAAPASPGAASPPRPETPSATPAGSGAGTSGASARPAASAAARPATTGGGSGSDDAIDLGGMLMPGMVRTYLPHAAVGLVGLLLGLRLGWKMGRWVGRHSRRNRKKQQKA